VVRVRVRVRMFIHLDYHTTAVADRVSHISSREDYIRPIAGTLWCLLHAGRCMAVRTWAIPGLPDDLMCTHTLYDYSGSQIYNIQELQYQIRIRWRDDPCKSPHYAICFPTPHYYYNVDGGYSGRPERAALHDSRTRRLLAVSPECR
jgi:hypothetical protein